MMFASAGRIVAAVTAASAAFSVLIRRQVAHIFFLWIWLLCFAHIKYWLLFVLAGRTADWNRCAGSGD